MDAVAQVAVTVEVERGRGIPVVGPGLRGPKLRRLVVVARDHVRVKRRVLVPEDGVVDAHGVRHGEHGIAERRHVGKEGGTLRAFQRIERRHDRIRQQQAIAGQYLAFAQHGPARGEARDEARVPARPQRVDTSMN